MTDSRGRPIRAGDLLRESWHFHGFTGFRDWGDVQEFRSRARTFRFLTYAPGMTLDSSRVNCMGWPVSGYEVEVVTEQQQSAMTKVADWDEYYQCWRESFAKSSAAEMSEL